MSGRQKGRGRGRLIRQKGADGRFVYIGDWVGSDGRRHRRVLSSDKSVAERMLAKLVRERDLVTAGMVVEDGGAAFLAEVVDAYLRDLETFRRPSYVESVRRGLEKLKTVIGPVRVRDVTPSVMLERRKKRLSAGVAHRTINLEAGALKTCFAWAVRAGMLGANPLAHLKPLPTDATAVARERRALTDDEIARFLRSAQEDDAQAEVRYLELRFAARSDSTRRTLGIALRRIPQSPFWTTLLACGLRWGEACALRWEDIDVDAGALTIRAEVAKTKQARHVPVPSYLMDVLVRLRGLHASAVGWNPAAEDAVFLGPKGRPLTKRDSANALKLLQRILDRAGIPKVDAQERTIDIHGLRGTAASRMLRHGVDLALVSEILGHSDVRLTMKHYVDLRITDTAAAIAKVPALEAAKPDVLAASAVGADEVGSILAIGAASVGSARRTASGTPSPAMRCRNTPGGNRTHNRRIRNRQSEIGPGDDMSGPDVHDSPADNDFRPSPFE